MKKKISFILVLMCSFVLAGCNHAKQEQVSTYSFYGTHDYFTISNGSITLGTTEEVFDGGDFKVTQSGMFEEVVSCFTIFYTFTNGERNDIFVHQAIDKTGGMLDLNGDLGTMSGTDCVIGHMVKSIEELKDNLWFELKTTDFNGEETVYQVQLTVTE